MQPVPATLISPELGAQEETPIPVLITAYSDKTFQFVSDAATRAPCTAAAPACGANAGST
jgi:ribosomal protein L11